jgi:predicted permease
MRVRLKLDQLRRLLAASNLTQNHWAMKLGISRGHWSDIVNGRHPYPSPKTRQRLLEVAGVPLDELFEVEQGPTVWHHTDFRAALQERYLVERELGQGAMGSVYLARDIARGRTVAVKILAPEAIGGVDADTLLREVSLVSRLQHPNILPLFDSGVAAGHPFYVMPWITDGSLRDRLRRDTRLPLGDVVALTAGIASALHHAHEKHVLHCDIKPENILLHGDHAYVMDFGIARVLHAEASEWRARNALETSAGTPAYVSPEQAAGDADLDGRADVYSLGCVVYEMLTGRAPFEGTTTEETVARRFFAPPRPIRDFAPETPGAVVRVVERAMQVSRDRRPATALEFARELGAAATGARRHTLAAASIAVTRALASVRRKAGRPAAAAFGGALIGSVQDARLALRGLWRGWKFAAAFVAPLALGLGAGATFYGIIDHVFYRPPPGVAGAEGIVRLAISIDNRDPFQLGNTSAAWIDYDAIRRTTTTLTDVAAFSTSTMSLGRGERARRIPVAFATTSFFRLTGVTPQAGRLYTAEEDQATATRVPCVASERLWRTEFGRATSALGAVLEVGSIFCEIVGIAPKGFNGMGYTPIDLWIPMRGAAQNQYGNSQLWTTDAGHWLRLYARARPGVSLANVGLDATQAYRSVGGRRRDPDLSETMFAESLLGGTRITTPRIRVARWLVAGSVALLVLVAANLVNLLVARNIGRIRETGIRIALGGGWTRLLRFHVFESIILATLAGAASLLVVRLAGPIARRVLFPGIEFADGPVTLRVVALATAASLVLAGIVALITALYARRVDPAALLAAGGSARTTAGRRAGVIRYTLVGVQAALSLALIVASAGFVRSFRNAAGSHLGFNVRGLIQAEVPNTGPVGGPLDAYVDMNYRLRERIRAIPGVASVSLAYTGPWWNNRTEAVAIPGRDSLPLFPGFGEPAFDAVTADHLRTMQLTMRAGRWIAESDAAGTPPVVVVNEALAKLYWPDESNVIGRCLRIGDNAVTCREIVGVVADHRFTGPIDAPMTPAYFVPLAQAGEYRVTPKLFIRASGDAAELQPVIRQLVQGFEPGLPAVSVEVMQARLDPLIASWRMGAMAFTALGIVAAVVAGIGLFSVLAFAVAERRREFAVRKALGAQTAHIVRTVAVRGLVVVGAGAVVGCAATWVSARWLQPMLFRTDLLEPVVLGVAVLAVLVLAVLAAAAPSVSAARMSPMEVLKSE